MSTGDMQCVDIIVCPLQTFRSVSFGEVCLPETLKYVD